MERWYAEAAAEPAAWLLDKYENPVALRMNAPPSRSTMSASPRATCRRCARPMNGSASRCRPSRSNPGARTPDAPVETFGTGNRCAFLRHGYIELIAIARPDALRQRRGPLPRALYRRCISWRWPWTDEEANLARLRAAGIDIPGVAWLQRPVEAGGPIAHFARLPFPDAPEGRVQLIRHLTPELVWDARWMGHANKRRGAGRGDHRARAEPAETTARLSRLAGLPAGARPGRPASCCACRARRARRAPMRR